MFEKTVMSENKLVAQSTAPFGVSFLILRHLSTLVKADFIKHKFPSRGNLLMWLQNVNNISMVILVGKS